MVDGLNTDRDVHISTRFGVGVNDEEWLRHRFMLFEAITAPSLRAQTYQDFVWNIFVGEDAFDWVVERLIASTEGVGREVIIHKTSQKSLHLTGVADTFFPSSPRLLALIDDDDAWSINFLEKSLNDAIKFIRSGQSRVVFTYPIGYEWMVCDLIDYDVSMRRGFIAKRKSGISKYKRPFHSMACLFVFVGAVPESFGGAHKSFGELLKDEGFVVKELSNRHPMWLYVRHKQADSNPRKAHAPIIGNITIEEIVNHFGVSKGEINKYASLENKYSYARKKNHKSKDKASMNENGILALNFDKEIYIDFDISILSVSIEPRGIRIFVSDLPKGRNHRVAIYDYKEKCYQAIEVMHAEKALISGEFIRSSVEETSNLLGIKIQSYEEKISKWIDRSKLRPISEILLSLKQTKEVFLAETGGD